VELQSLKMGEETVGRDLTGINRIAARFGDRSLVRIRQVIHAIAENAR